jgi:hypothetical protein
MDELHGGCRHKAGMTPMPIETIVTDCGSMMFIGHLITLPSTVALLAFDWCRLLGGRQPHGPGANPGGYPGRQSAGQIRHVAGINAHTRAPACAAFTTGK